MGLFEAPPLRQNLPGTSVNSGSDTGRIGGYVAGPRTQTFMADDGYARANSECRAGACPSAASTDEVDLRVLKLEQRLGELSRSYADLQRSHEKMNRQLTALLAERTRARPDLATTSHSEASVIARQYRSIIEQQMHTVARAYGHRSPLVAGVTADKRVPLLIGKLSEVLFTEHYLPKAEAVMNHVGVADDPEAERLFGDLREAVNDLRRRSRQIGLPARWDFTFEAFTLCDGNTQEPWTSCEPEAKVRFLVAPSYIVDGQIFARQYVFTEVSSR